MYFYFTGVMSHYIEPEDDTDCSETPEVLNLSSEMVLTISGTDADDVCEVQDIFDIDATVTSSQVIEVEEVLDHAELLDDIAVTSMGCQEDPQQLSSNRDLLPQDNLETGTSSRTVNFHLIGDKATQQKSVSLHENMFLDIPFMKVK